MHVSQHTVPAFYLKRFSISLDRRKIAQFDCTSGMCETVSIRKASTVNNCYSFRETTGEWNDKAEHYIGEIESKAAPVLAKLIEGGVGSLVRVERYRLAEFLAVQLRRPGSQARAFRDTLRPLINDPEVILEELERSLPKLRERHTLEEIEDYRRRLRAGDVEWQDPDGSAKGAGLQVLFDRLPEKANAIDSMEWQILKAVGDSWFVTSDTPAFVCRSTREFDPGIVGVVRADLDAELRFPLSPAKLLIASHNPIAPTAKAGAQRVRELNRRAILQADRWIYEHRCSIETHELIEERTSVQASQPIG